MPDQSSDHPRPDIPGDRAYWVVPGRLMAGAYPGNTDPAVARRLRMGAVAALDQRVAVRFALSPMDLGESSTYLRHHLALVGRSDPLFADDAVARLHRVANGLPRALNNAATAALVAAAADGKALVHDVQRQARGHRAHPRLTRPLRPHLVVNCTFVDDGVGITSSPSPPSSRPPRPRRWLGDPHHSAPPNRLQRAPPFRVHPAPPRTPPC